LDQLGVGSADRTRDPLVENARAVWPLAGIPEILGCLEDTRIQSVNDCVLLRTLSTKRIRAANATEIIRVRRQQRLVSQPRGELPSATLLQYAGDRLRACCYRRAASTSILVRNAASAAVGGCSRTGAGS